MLSMKEAIENYVEGCVGKVDCPAYKLFMKAILAGMMIAFGAAGSSVAAHDIVNVGIARLVAGVVFPMGLMMVVMTGAELFTGDCLAIMATVQKKHTALKLIRMLVVVYFGNLLGSLMLTCLALMATQPASAARKYLIHSSVTAGSARSALFSAYSFGLRAVMRSISGFRLESGMRASSSTRLASTCWISCSIMRRVLVMWPGNH